MGKGEAMTNQKPFAWAVVINDKITCIYQDRIPFTVAGKVIPLYRAAEHDEIAWVWTDGKGNGLKSPRQFMSNE